MTVTPVKYKLHNRSTGVDLKHPKFGLWDTNDISEALEMRDACKDYLRAIGLDNLIPEVIIKTVETGEEVC